MNASVYLETTIISYLTARPSRDLILAAHQQLTQEWWDTQRADFSLYISQLVIREASAGAEDAVQRRLEVMEEIPLLTLDEASLSLAKSLIDQGALPGKAAEDALHIAVATVHGMDYLLTWNMKHIANATMRSRIEQVCRLSGYEPSVICTPEELLGGAHALGG